MCNPVDRGLVRSFIPINRDCDSNQVISDYLHPDHFELEHGIHDFYIVYNSNTIDFLILDDRIHNHLYIVSAVQIHSVKIQLMASLYQ